MLRPERVESCVDRIHYSLRLSLSAEVGRPQGLAEIVVWVARIECRNEIGERSAT